MVTWVTKRKWKSFPPKAYGYTIQVTASKFILSKDLNDEKIFFTKNNIFSVKCTGKIVNIFEFKNKWNITVPRYWLK